jgi:hypothetical protein
MSGILFVTSNEEFLTSIAKEFSLTQITPLLYEGSKEGKQIDLLLLENNKIDATLVLTHFLSGKPELPNKVVILNPVQCPDINQPLGKVVMAEEVTLWDHKETRLLSLQTIETDYKTIIGKGISGDRECVNKTTPIMQSKLVDCITYPVAKVSDFFSLPVMSIGIIADYCTQNYSKLLQSNIKELSVRMLDFLNSCISTILGD